MNTFITWLMGLTRIMRYFVVAVMFHVGILAVLGSIKIVAIMPKIVASFTGGNAPPPIAETAPEDPYAVYRDFEYNGPTLGGGGGTPGKGPGGVPTAGGGTPDKYTAHILSGQSAGENPSVGEVIGVFSDAATAVARPAGTGGGGMSMGGLGGAIGTGGIRGPGGNIMGARMGPQRSVAIQKFGATQATEKAVMAALRWLKQHQEPNGSWKMSHDPAGTSLAILAFLGHGETPDSPEFGATVDKGFRYLLTTVPSNGVVTGNMYVQGLAALALSEGYALTQSPMLREPLERVIKVILVSQKVPKDAPKNEGGWRYSPDSKDADLSVAGWQIMALKSARNAGIEIPSQAFKKAEDYVWNMYGGPGFGYSGPNTAPAMTAVGVLCQQFLGNSDDRRLRPALDYLSKPPMAPMDWEKGGTLYGWYYTTQAMFQGGRNYWTDWNKTMRDVLVKSQNEDGHWDAPAKSTETYGPVFSTTFCTLMLEVYYRYLPMYQLTSTATASGPSTPGAAGAAAPGH